MKPLQVVGAKMALPKDKWVGLIEQTLLVASAAALTYLTQHLGKEDFGVYTPAVVAGATILLNYIQKILNNPIAPDPAPTPLPTPTPLPPGPNPAPSPDHNTNNDHDFPIG